MKTTPQRSSELLQTRGRQLLRAFTDRRPSGNWLGYWSQGHLHKGVCRHESRKRSQLLCLSLGKSQRLSGANFPQPDFRGVWAAHFYGTGVIRQVELTPADASQSPGTPSLVI